MDCIACWQPGTVSRWLLSVPIRSRPGFCSRLVALVYLTYLEVNAQKGTSTYCAHRTQRQCCGQDFGISKCLTLPTTALARQPAHLPLFDGRLVPIGDGRQQPQRCRQRSNAKAWRLHYAWTPEKCADVAGAIVQLGVEHLDVPCLPLIVVCQLGEKGMSSGACRKTRRSSTVGIQCGVRVATRSY